MSSASSPLPAHFSHWQLSREPFRPVLRWPEDRAMLYHSRSWEEATARVQYVIENQFGLAILTGPSGAGKTLLLEAAADQLSLQNIRPLRHQCQSGTADDPLGQPADWEIRQVLSLQTSAARPILAHERYALLLDDFDCVPQNKSRLQQLIDRVLHQRQLGCLVLAISQERSTDLFETLASYAPLTISLKALSDWESCEYLEHRLQQAGGSAEIFEEEAALLLYEKSEGIPRWLNRLAHDCLLVGALRNLSTIPADLVAETVQSIKWPLSAGSSRSLRKAA